MTKTNAGGVILEMLAEEHDLLVKVGELAAVQRRIIEEDEAEQLVAVLEQRALILSKATALAGSIEAATRKIDPSDPQAALISQRGQAVSELARAIADADRGDGAELARKRDTLARTLAGMNSRRAANAAYTGDTGPARPGFQDRRV